MKSVRHEVVQCRHGDIKHFFDRLPARCVSTTSHTGPSMRRTDVRDHRLPAPLARRRTSTRTASARCACRCDVKLAPADTRRHARSCARPLAAACRSCFARVGCARIIGSTSQPGLLLHRARREADSLGKAPDLILVRDLDFAGPSSDRGGLFANQREDAESQQQMMHILDESAGFRVVLEKHTGIRSDRRCRRR